MWKVLNESFLFFIPVLVVYSGLMLLIFFLTDKTGNRTFKRVLLIIGIFITGIVALWMASMLGNCSFCAIQLIREHL